jgi:hypothetical protein
MEEGRAVLGRKTSTLGTPVTAPSCTTRLSFSKIASRITPTEVRRGLAVPVKTRQNDGERFYSIASVQLLRRRDA